MIPEFCNMTGLTDDQRKNFGLMKDIAVHTKLTPLDRYNQSINSAKKIKASIASSGLNVKVDNSDVNAVRLNPPVLTFGGNKTLVPSLGNFDMRQHIADSKLVLNNQEWGFIYPERDRDSFDAFFDTLAKAARSYNIEFTDPFFFEQKGTNPKDWMSTLQGDFKKNGVPKFVISYAPNMPATSSLYPQIKQFLLKDVGVEH